MRIIAGLLLVGISVASSAPSADTSKPTAPVLIELFTSEGCSSCPPADEFLRKLDTAQPIPGVRLIVLSEHVDYWDHDGWKDPYSSSLFTNRQTSYCQALRMDEPYTPQMIADGSAVLKISNPRQMDQAIETAAASPKVPLTIRSVAIDGKTLRGHIQTGPANLDAGVYVAVALDHAESQVLRGENQGRHLAHTAVVESLKKIGKLQSGSAFDQDFQLKLSRDADPQNLRVIAFVQEGEGGKVLGAAEEKPPLR